jgi:prepilin-type N-terminal cleavage/methylation domain-containing protein
MAIATRSPAQAGFSLIELVIASSLLSLMIFAVSTLAVSGGEAQELARRLNRATEITHDLLDEMRTGMTACVRIFGNDTEGTENLALLDLGGVPVPLASSRLPTAAASTLPRPDTACDEITGNQLFFATLAWSDCFECSSGNEYYVDIYRWQYYYLTAEDGGPTAGRPIGLNMVRIESEPLIDAGSIDRITDPTDQQEVLMHLANATPDSFGETHARCEVVWSRGALPSVVGTLRQVDPTDGLMSATPFGTRPSPWNVLRSETSVPNLLTYRHHSVATNFAPPAFGVCDYAISDPSGDGFPHGFEVQVTGPATARQVLLHLVIASTQRRGHYAWSDAQVAIDARDL